MLQKLVGIAFVGSLALAQNLVQNPGFETGSFAPWVASNQWSVENDAPAHTGTYFAETGCAGAPCISPDSNLSGAWFYQDLATSPGATYTLTFFYAPQEGAPAAPLIIKRLAARTRAQVITPPVEIQVLWGPSATPLTTGGAGACSGNCVFDNTSGGTSSYSQFTVTNLTASSASTRLEFLGREDPGADSVDDVVVSLSAPGGVPVPPSIWLTLLGLACAGFYFGWRGLAHPVAN
ncbi:MAG TPA: hypothetical protein VGR73_10750 [Bryobacteraceae bacterium]|nr:hypothetical protein [Bryobacteraceae bacterium]